MAVRQGGTRKFLELHVTVSYNPANASTEWSRARGQTPLPNGGTLRGAAAQSSQEAVRRARELADGVILSIAQDAARLATRAYSEVGFGGIGVVVGPRQGTMYPLLIRGENAQKYARILEDDTTGMDLHAFISGARKRREIKVTRKVGEKTYARGKKDERVGGFYLIVPKVLGTVKRGANGRFEFTGKGGETLSRSNQDALGQFEATPEAQDFFVNHDDPNTVSEYRTGRVKETFTPKKGPDGRIVMDFKVTPEKALGNEIFETVKYTQRVRKAGIVLGGEHSFRDGREGGYRADTQQHPSESRRTQDRANKRGFEAMRALGVQNLRVNSPDAGLQGGGDTAQATVGRQKGQVVSFLTLSTRSENRQLPGRKGYHILKQAGEYMRDRLREEITSARSAMRGTGSFAERAYLEVLESASR